MAEAEESFKHLLSRQSTTLKKAVVEYRRRYGRNPPKGFDQWWDFARRNNVKIVDDYDAIFEDLAPFREMSGEEFRARVDVVRGTPPLVGQLANIPPLGWSPSERQHRSDTKWRTKRHQPAIRF